MKKIICIVGMPGSGKTYAANALAKKYKVRVIHSGDVIREEIKRKGLKYSPHTDAVIAHWFHTQGRDKFVVERIWKKARNSKKKMVVIEGFRSKMEVNYLEKLSEVKPIVIAIIAPLEIRIKREIKRGRFGKEESTEYIKSRDKLEISHGIKKLIEKADYKIDNSKTDADKKILKLIRKV
jgi:dephospho-CoA kinase